MQKIGDREAEKASENSWRGSLLDDTRISIRIHIHDCIRDGWTRNTTPNKQVAQ